jgi:hypothetical protein
MASRIIQMDGPGTVKINSTFVGNTIGKPEIIIRKQQIPVSRPDSIHPFKYLKTGLSVQVRFKMAKHSLDNLAKAFGVSSLTSPVTSSGISSSAVPSYSMDLTVAGIKYSFTSVIENGSNFLMYDIASPDISLVFNVVIGSSGTVATLGGSSLPAQFDYAVYYPWRGSEMKTFGGTRLSAASSLLDGEIYFVCDNMTSAEKTTLLGLYTGNSCITELAFTGIHSDSATVLFWDMRPFRERNGLWSTSGTLKIKY